MGTAQIVPTRTDFANSVHRLAVFAHVHALGEMMQHTQLIGIHDELLKARHQPAFKPTRSMQHEVHAREQAHVQAVRGLVSGLRVGQFRTAEGAGTAIGKIQAARDLAHAIGDLCGFRCAEGRCARVHHLRQRPDHRNRRHRAAHDKGRDDRGLVVLCVNLKRTHHRTVKGQGRVNIDQRGHDRVLGHEVLAE